MANKTDSQGQQMVGIFWLVDARLIIDSGP
jgi:hypothetical protein